VPRRNGTTDRAKRHGEARVRAGGRPIPVGIVAHPLPLPPRLHAPGLTIAASGQQTGPDVFAIRAGRTPPPRPEQAPSDPVGRPSGEQFLADLKTRREKEFR